jgi:GNAT superfamily N-acetyltransferase
VSASAAADVSPLLRSERRGAARLLGAAFLDDPGWRAVGPDRTRRRRRYVERICGAETRFGARCGGFVLATRDDGRVSGVLVAYPPEAWPLPWWTILYGLPGATLAGPRAVARSLAAQEVLDRGHPPEPHLFVALLAVAPDLQRGGRGRALLGEALRRADAAGVPAYLDTARPENVPYYRSFGFAELGQATLPRDAPLWYLQRPVGGRGP